MKTLREIRNEHILKVLEKADWNVKEASAILKVSEGFLRKKMQNIIPAEIKKPKEK